MTLRQIEYLLAVANAGSFTAAAKELYVSQPSLSQQIRALEEEVGGELVERGPAGVRLTPAGKAFANEAKCATRAAERAAVQARQALARTPRVLSVVTIRSLTTTGLPGCISHWHKHHRDIVVKLREVDHRRLVRAALETGAGDVGLAPRLPDWKGATKSLGWEELVVVVPPQHPAAGAKDPLMIDDLRDSEWILLDEGQGLREHADTLIRDAGFTPRVAARTTQVEAAVQLARAGVGVCLVPLGSVSKPQGVAAHVRHLQPAPWCELAAHVIPRTFEPPASELVEVMADAGWANEPPQGARVMSGG